MASLEELGHRRPVAMRADALPLDDGLMEELQVWVDRPDPAEWVPPHTTLQSGLLHECPEADEAVETEIQLAADWLIYDQELPRRLALTQAVRGALEFRKPYYINMATQVPRPHYFEAMGNVLVRGSMFDTAFRRDTNLRLNTYGAPRPDYPGYLDAHAYLCRTVHAEFPSLLQDIAHKFDPANRQSAKDIMAAAFLQAKILEWALNKSEIRALEDVFIGKKPESQG